MELVAKASNGYLRLHLDISKCDCWIFLKGTFGSFTALLGLNRYFNSIHSLQKHTLPTYILVVGLHL